MAFRYDVRAQMRLDANAYDASPGMLQALF
jgi:hypothetical protein